MSGFPPTRVTSLLLAAVVTGALLGSIEWVAAEQVNAARLAHLQSSANSPVASAAACGVDG